MLELTQEHGRIHVLTPEWAEPFLALGASAASLSRNGKRQVFAALVPSRCFVAPLIALGAVLAKPPAISPDTHEWKLNLPAGTECWFPVGGKFVKCNVTSSSGSTDRPLVVRTLAALKGAPAGTTVHVPRAMLCRLLPVEEPGDGAGTRMQARGRAVVERLFGKDASYAYFGERKLDVVLCGVAADLLEESKFVDVCIDGEHTTLLHLLRPRWFVGERSGYRSDVVTALQRPRTGSANLPSLVVFDGAYAYINWWKAFKNTPSVIILDESSASHGRLAAAIDRLHDLRERGTFIRDVLPEGGPQIELMAVEY
jgi:hypothetical protein